MKLNIEQIRGILHRASLTRSARDCRDGCPIQTCVKTTLPKGATGYWILYEKQIDTLKPPNHYNEISVGVHTKCGSDVPLPLRATRFLSNAARKMSGQTVDDASTIPFNIEVSSCKYTREAAERAKTFCMGAVREIQSATPVAVLTSRVVFRIVAHIDEKHPLEDDLDVDVNLTWVVRTRPTNGKRITSCAPAPARGDKKCNR